MVTIDQMIALGKELAGDGMVQGAGGNLSFRQGEWLFVTISGAWFERLQPADFVKIHIDEPRQELLQRTPKPTSEASMHQAAYKLRPEATVVIHAHPPQALCLGMLGMALPAMTPDGYLHLGGLVPLVPYTTPTTQELADAIEAEIVRQPVILLQNHGVLVTGPTYDEARLRLRLLEEQAGIYLQAVQISAEGPRVFNSAEKVALDELTGGKYRYG